MKIIVFTDYSTCAYCKKIKPVIYGAQFQAWLGQNKVQLVSADRSADPNVYAALKRQWQFSGQYPTVYVVGENGKQLARFVARGYTAAKLIAKIAPYCAGCSDGGAAPAAQTKTCPTCKGLGVVSALLLACVTLCGCVATRAAYKPATEPGGKPTVEFRRIAIFYPFAIEDLILPDGIKLGKYSTSGGATELVPLVDAGGKILGYVAKGAVEGAK